MINLVSKLKTSDHWKQAEFIVHCIEKDSEGYTEEQINAWNPELAKCLLDIREALFHLLIEAL